MLAKSKSGSVRNFGDGENGGGNERLLFERVFLIGIRICGDDRGDSSSRGDQR